MFSSSLDDGEELTGGLGGFCTYRDVSLGLRSYQNFVAGRVKLGNQRVLKMFVTLGMRAFYLALDITFELAGDEII